MKITSFSTLLTAAAAAVVTAGAVGAPIAFADDAADVADVAEVATHSLGSQTTLNNGDVVQGWTVSSLKPSSDAIPYPVSGKLWEATATDEAIQGSVAPIVFNFNARSSSGQTYRALFGLATPEGVNPATIAQGQETSGKVYFDVTADSPDSPDSVVYNAGGQDLLLWVQPPPAPQTEPRYTTPYQSGSQATSAPATSVQPTPTTAPGQPPAAPLTVEGTPAPAGSQGTPLPAGSQGTPIPAGSQGTPLPAGSQGAPAPAAPAPASAEGAPLPASAGTAPLPAGSQGTPLPAGSQEAPLPAGSPGTPAVAPTAPVTTTTVPPAPTS